MTIAALERFVSEVSARGLDRTAITVVGIPREELAGLVEFFAREGFGVFCQLDSPEDEAALRAEVEARSGETGVVEIKPGLDS